MRVDDALARRLHELNADVERALEAGDEPEPHAALQQLAETVRSSGEKFDSARSLGVGRDRPAD